MEAPDCFCLNHQLMMTNGLDKLPGKFQRQMKGGANQKLVPVAKTVFLLFVFKAPD